MLNGEQQQELISKITGLENLSFTETTALITEGIIGVCTLINICGRNLIRYQNLQGAKEKYDQGELKDKPNYFNIYKVVKEIIQKINLTQQYH